MKIGLTLFAIVGLGAILSGCHIGESTAPKPDPAQFLPKSGTAGGPPPSSPSSK